jgi:hypothetical protein
MARRPAGQPAEDWSKPPCDVPAEFDTFNPASIPQPFTGGTCMAETENTTPAEEVATPPPTPAEVPEPVPDPAPEPPAPATSE